MGQFNCSSVSVQVIRADGYVINNVLLFPKSFMTLAGSGDTL